MAIANTRPNSLQVEQAEIALKKIRALTGLISTTQEVLTDDDVRWTAVALGEIADEGLKALNAHDTEG
ncbi:hypothetical protein [Arenimonas aestuarii]